MRQWRLTEEWRLRAPDSLLSALRARTRDFPEQAPQAPLAPLRRHSPGAASAARLAVLDAAEAARWPRLALGRLVIGPGETRWRQGVTLAEPEEVQAIAAGLAIVTDGRGLGSVSQGGPRRDAGAVCAGRRPRRGPQRR